MTIKKTWLALLLISLSNLLANPYGFRKHRFGLSLGSTFEHFRDEQASPLAYHGTSFPVRFSYSYFGITNLHHLDIAYKHFLPESSTGRVAEFFNGNVEYSYLRFMKTIFQGKVDLYVGGEWKNSMSARLFDYSEWGLGESFQGGAYSSICGAIVGEHRLTGTRILNYEVAVPLVTYAIRSGYAYWFPDRLARFHDVNVFDILKGGDFVTVDRFRGFYASVSYNEVKFNHLLMNIEYAFTYYQHSLPRMLRVASNHLYFGFSWMM